MTKILTNHGDILKGKRIYAEFKDWTPKKAPKIVNDKSKYILKKKVFCQIIKPIISKF